MDFRVNVLAIFLILLSIAGCATASSQVVSRLPERPWLRSKIGAETSTAATVTAPVKEAALTTITLSPDAEARLAIATVPVERRTIATTRIVGAEIAAPMGAAFAITAPVAGTLQSPPGVPAAGFAVSRGQPLFRLVPIQPSDRDAATARPCCLGEQERNVFRRVINLMAARQLVQERLFRVATAPPAAARPPVILSPLSSLSRVTVHLDRTQSLPASRDLSALRRHVEFG
jgi:hypothetical protein